MPNRQGTCGESLYFAHSPHLKNKRSLLLDNSTSWTPEDLVTDLQSWQLNKFAFSSPKEKLVRLLHSSFTSFLGTRCPRQNLALIFFSGFELSVRSTATSLWAGFPLWRTDKSISKEDLKANFFSGTPDKNMTETQIYTGKQILNYAFFKIEVSENSSLPF